MSFFFSFVFSSPPPHFKCDCHRSSPSPSSLSRLFIPIPPFPSQDIIEGKLPCDTEIVNNEIVKILNKKKTPPSSSALTIEMILNQAKEEEEALKNEGVETNDFATEEGSSSTNSLLLAGHPDIQRATGGLPSPSAASTAKKQLVKMVRSNPDPMTIEQLIQAKMKKKTAPTGAIAASGVATVDGALSGAPNAHNPSITSFPSPATSTTVSSPRQIVLNSNHKYRIVEVAP